jgi:hypothetical protein
MFKSIEKSLHVVFLQKVLLINFLLRFFINWMHYPHLLIEALPMTIYASRELKGRGRDYHQVKLFEYYQIILNWDNKDLPFKSYRLFHDPFIRCRIDNHPSLFESEFIYNYWDASAVIVSILICKDARRLHFRYYCSLFLNKILKFKDLRLSMQARVSNLLPFVPILLRSCIRKEILRSRN